MAFDWSCTSTNNGYICVRATNHPYAWSTGYIFAHRAVMEHHLGRYLEPDEVVHHINGNKTDNRLENLELMKRKDHTAHHGAAKVRAMVILDCPQCLVPFLREKRQTHLSKGGERTFCTRRCGALYHHAKRLGGD